MLAELIATNNPVLGMALKSFLILLLTNKQISANVTVLYITLLHFCVEVIYCLKMREKP